MTLPFPDARQSVIEAVRGAARPAAETVSLDAAAGRVLASEVRTDRAQPPFDRVTRDGFAVRAADVRSATAAAPASLAVIGEALPGRVFAGRLAPGQAIEIMTGAPLVAGADAVVMVEHTKRSVHSGVLGAVLIERPVAPGENVVPAGSELAADIVALGPGVRLDPAAIALLASLGCARPRVFAAPRVAIIGTGDELVDVDETPTPVQIRDSNRHSLAAQVRRAGAVPVPRPVVRDQPSALEAAIAEALPLADLLLLSGGVSMGKHDYVEGALAANGARVLFDGVAIRPGKPVVFGTVAGKPFFGLPGNPLSTQVTFELFVRPALALLGGESEAPLRFTLARLGAPYTQRPVALTAFVPARLRSDPGTWQVEALPLPSQGSGDVGAMARAEALIVITPGTSSLAAGDLVAVLPK